MLHVTTWNLKRLEASTPDYPDRLSTIVQFISRFEPEVDILALQELRAKPEWGPLNVPVDLTQDERVPAFEDLCRELGFPEDSSLLSPPGNLGNRTAILSSLPVRLRNGIRDCCSFVKFPIGAFPQHPRLKQDPERDDWLIDEELSYSGSLNNTPTLAVRFPWPRFSRPVLFASYLLSNGAPINVLCVHLKSKKERFDFDEHIPSRHRRQDTSDIDEMARGTFRSLQARAHEALAVRLILSDLMKERVDEPFLVLGDLNDDLDSLTTQILEGRPLRSIQDLMVTENDLKSIFDVTLFLEAGARWSYVRKGSRVALDHIFASLPLARKVATVEGEPSVRVYNEFLINRGEYPSFSDHAPVSVTFDVYS